MMLLRPTKPSARARSTSAEYASSMASNVSWRTISSCASVSRRRIGKTRHGSRAAMLCRRPRLVGSVAVIDEEHRDVRLAEQTPRQRVGGHAPRAASTASVVGAQARIAASSRMAHR